MSARTLRATVGRWTPRAAILLLCSLLALAVGGGLAGGWAVSTAPAMAAGPGEMPVILPAPRSGGQPDYVEGQVLVRTKAPVQVAEGRVVATQALQPLSQVVQSLGGTVDWAKPARYQDGSVLLTVQLPSGVSVQEGLQRLQPLRQAGTIAYAQPNYLYYPDDLPMPNDPYFPYNYDLHNTGQVFVPPLGLAGTPDADIDAPEAWSVHQPSGRIVIAVIDTGIWTDHPDLKAQIWTNPGEIPGNGVDDDGNGYVDDVHGWDFVNNDPTVWDVGDDDFHGTHVAGTIGASMNNGVGSAGINPRIQIMSLKFLGVGGGSTANAVLAVEYATRMGADLTTNSWGGGGYDQALYDAIQESGQHGLLFVAAAGNDGVDDDISPHYPSSYDLPNIIAVASSDWNDQLSSFSNYGLASVDLAAPGDYILSTYWRLVNGRPAPSYVWASGTSMATPHVSGVAALLLDRFPDRPTFPGAPGYRPGDLTIKDLLMYSGDPQPQFVGKMIAPVRLNAYNALTQRMFPIIETVRVNGKPWGARVAPAAAGAPVEVTLSATVKTPFSQLAAVRWDFGDGSEPVTGVQTEVRHLYRTAGVYEVTAAVTDTEGDTSTAWATAVVAGPDGQPPLALVVDDDADGPAQEAVAAALQASWIPYVVTTPRALLRLDPAELREPLFWTAGAATSPLSADEQAFLAAFQQAGGRWFLTGQDVLTDLAGSAFAQAVLHVRSVQEDVGLSALAGIDGDPISNGLGVIPLTYPAGYQDRADTLTATPDGDAAFTSPAGTTPVVRYLSSDPAGPRSVLAAFEFAAIPSGGEANVAADIIRRIYRFLTSPDVNLPPVVVRTIPGEREIGEIPLQVDLRAEVIDPVQTATVQEAYWDFGDGSPRVRVSAPGYAASHTYTTPGVYQARLQVVDDQGEDTWASRTLIALPVGTQLLVVDGGVYSSVQAQEAGWQRLTAAIDQLHLPAVMINRQDLVDATASDGILNGAWDYLLLWTTGEVGYTDRADRVAVAEFLDNHGRLILSGQDELFGLWPDQETGRPFAQRYLHVADVLHDVGVPLIVGYLDPVSQGLVIEPRPVYSDWSDVILPGTGAQPLFLRPINPDDPQSDFIPNALVYRGEDHSLIFTAFPLEFIPLQSLVATPQQQQLASAVWRSATGASRPPAAGQLTLLNQRDGKPAGVPGNWPLYFVQGPVQPEELVPVTGTLPQVLARAYHSLGGTTNVPPVILLAGVDRAGPVEPGTSILLVTAAEDVDGTIARATVDWGDGTGAVPAQVNQTHAYATPGVYTIRVTYEDDQGAQSVASGQVAVRYFPQAQVTPERIGLTLNRSARGQVALALANADDKGTLTYQAKVSAGSTWLKVTPAQGQVAPGAQASLQVTIDTSQLAVGEYAGSIQIATDDPDQATITVPVQLQVADTTVQLSAPQAGDVWAGVKEIRWQAQDPDGDELRIQLEFSPDEGTTWKPIVASTENDGVFAWDTRQVGAGGDRFRVRVTASDAAGHQTAATSGKFTIAVLRGKVTSGPNPAHDTVTFYYSVSAPATLYVYDIQGELVFQHELSPAANQYVWELTNLSGRPLASGLYLFTVVDADGTASEVGRLTIVR